MGSSVLLRLTGHTACCRPVLVIVVCFTFSVYSILMQHFLPLLSVLFLSGKLFSWQSFTGKINMLEIVGR